MFIPSKRMGVHMAPLFSQRWHCPPASDKFLKIAVVTTEDLTVASGV